MAATGKNISSMVCCCALNVACTETNQNSNDYIRNSCRCTNNCESTSNGSNNSSNNRRQSNYYCNSDYCNNIRLPLRVLQQLQEQSLLHMRRQRQPVRCTSATVITTTLPPLPLLRQLFLLLVQLRSPTASLLPLPVQESTRAQRPTHPNVESSLFTGDY
jgi:hypothetical protein